MNIWQRLDKLEQRMSNLEQDMKYKVDWKLNGFVTHEGQQFPGLLQEFEALVKALNLCRDLSAYQTFTPLVTFTKCKPKKKGDRHA